MSFYERHKLAKICRDSLKHTATGKSFRGLFRQEGGEASLASVWPKLKMLTPRHLRARCLSVSSLADKTEQEPWVIRKIYALDEKEPPPPLPLFHRTSLTALGFLTLFFTQEGFLAGIGFDEEPSFSSQRNVLSIFKEQFPFVHLHEEKASVLPYERELLLFLFEDVLPSQPIPLCLIGPRDVLQIWCTLRHIPRGSLISYTDLALFLEKKKTDTRKRRYLPVRQIGRLIGMNPLALLLPCHRIIGKDGHLCGYRWGMWRKAALLLWEM